MKLGRTSLAMCLLYTLPTALAETNFEDVPGDHVDSGQSFVASSKPLVNNVPIALDDHHSDQYEWINLEGFWIRIRLPEQMDVEQLSDYTQMIDLLHRQLKRAQGVLPERAFAQLQSKVQFFVKDDCTDGGDIFYRRYESEPDVGWVTMYCFKFLRNLLEDAYHGGEEVHGRSVWGYPSIILHELAHGWHDLIVEDGYDNRMVEAFYLNALSCLGNTDRANPYYWETDKKEFFAEFTVMYYLGHWERPYAVWEMDRKYRLLIIRLWRQNVYENWEDHLAPCTR